MFGSTQNNSFGSFGGSSFGSTASTPFGGQASGGGFGASSFGSQTSSTAGSAFGTPAPSTGSAFGGGGGFGSTGGAGFGSTPAFGQAAQPAQGGGVFGAPAAGGAFGAPAAGASAFGQPTSGFGQPAQGGAFGATTGTSAFGQQPTTGFGSGGAFGQPAAAATPSAFGATTTGFGAQQTSSAFGAPKQQGFGMNQPSQFGATTTGNSAFGAAPAFGAGTSSAFGSTATTGFGAGAGTGFGTGGTTSAFGSTAAKPATGGMFGGSTFGAAPSTPFGQQTGATGAGFGSPFGKPAAGGAFGTTGMGSTFGGGMSTPAASGGTKTTPYRPTMVTESTKTGGQQKFNIQVISAMKEYQEKTLEELRYEDYMIMKGGAAPTATTGFGAAPATPGGFGTSSGGFGTTPATSAFGTATTSTGFGAPAFGAPATSTFGAAPSAFGTSAPTTSGFGTTGTSAFGGAPSTPFGTTGGAFGTTSGFGTPGAAAAPATTGFGTTAATGTSAFGTTSTPAFGASTGFGTTGGGLGGFGTTPASTTTTSGFGGFGTAPAASTTTTGFGAATTGGFGTTAPATGTLGGFGTLSSTTAAPSGFGTTSTLGGFGSTPSTTTSSFGSGLGFGAAAKPSTPTTLGFGTPAATTAPTSTFGTSFGSLGGTSSFGTASTTTPSLGSFGSAAAAPAATTGTSGFGTLGGGFGTGLGTFGSTPSATTTSSFGSFGAPSTLGAFGAAPQTAGATAPAATPAPATTEVPLTIEQKIDLLSKKKDEILSGIKGKDAELEKAMELPPASMLFAGMSSAPALSVRGGSSSHAKIVPRGLQSMRAATRSSSASTVMSSLLSTGTSLPRSVVPLSTPAAGLTHGNAKRLVISSMPTPSSELPLPPRSVPSREPAPVQTPLRAFSPRRDEDEVDLANKFGVGEATGLTPSKGGTPLAPRAKSLDFSLAVQSPAASRVSSVIESEVDESSIPTLDKEGYFCTPDIAVLRKWTPSQLAKVKNFAVFRPEFGKIEWEGETDIRGLNLDDIVKIEHNEVFVYEGMVEPPEGEGLNKPATITLYNVFPKKGQSAEKLRAYEEKLRRFCVSNDADFISYNSADGVLVFAVKHFSRYGLDDEDEEDEPSPSTGDKVSVKEGEDAMDIAESEQATNQLKSILLKNRSLSVPAITDAVPALAPQITQSSDQLVVIQSASRGELKDEPIYNPRSIFSPGFATIADEWRDPEPKIGFSLPHECPDILKLLSELETAGKIDAHRSNYTRPFDQQCGSLDEKKTIKDFKLAMGRSFRVSWSADGRLAHPGRHLFAAEDPNFTEFHRVAIEQVNVESWQSSYWPESVQTQSEVVDASFQAMFDASESEERDTSVTRFLLAECSLERLDSYSSFLVFLKRIKSIFVDFSRSEMHPNRSLLQAFELFDAVVGQEKTDMVSLAQGIPMDLAEDRSSGFPEQWERRKVALSRWFELITEHEVPNKSTFIDDEDVHRHVFDLLTVHRIDEAVAVLEDAGMFRLAMLLSQIGSDASNFVLMRHQLELWSSMDVLYTIPDKLLDVYTILGGLLKLDESKSILRGVGWARGLAMLFWYYSESDSPALAKFSDLLPVFQELVENEEANEPLSPFVNEEKRTVCDGLFSLLYLIFSCFGKEKKSDEVLDASLTNALMSEGFTRDPLDHFGVYLVLCVLEAMGLASADSTQAIIVRQHMIFQLLSRQQWKWACFVAMQFPHVHQREWLVRDIISRFAPQIGWEEDATEGADHLQVLARFGIQQKWLDEATAIFAGYHHLVREQVDYCQRAEMWREASTALCAKIIPHCVVNDKDLRSLSDLLFSLDEKFSFAAHNHLLDLMLCNIVLKYMSFYECVQEEPSSKDEQRNLAESILSDIGSYCEKNHKLVDSALSSELVRQMLERMSSFAYRHLAKMDAETTAPSKTVLLRMDVLKFGKVPKDCVREAFQTSLESFMRRNAGCMKL